MQQKSKKNIRQDTLKKAIIGEYQMSLATHKAKQMIE
jgi:hypothetical protein